LRSRFYNPTDGRFQSRDTWGGSYNLPQSLNRWNYTQSNPVNFTDPTGNSICYNPLPASCQTGLIYANAFATVIKDYVKSGTIQPVEGFAMFADLNKDHFEDTRDLVWAMTIVLDDMDANRGPIWPQAIKILMGGTNSPYFIHQDWLPYMNNSEYDTKLEEGEFWCDPQDKSICVDNMKWTHSLRGDWNKKYWDKTANQAYHFWFYVGVAFFDGTDLAEIGNLYHDKGKVTTYDFNDPLKENEAPPPWNVSSQPDKDLAFQGIVLGWKLRNDHLLQSLSCSTLPDYFYTDIGSWIRSHLK
jgi:hypothetical protein